MATNLEFSKPAAISTAATSGPGIYLAPLGRILLSLIFFTTLFTHFSPVTIAYAASQGVPFAGFLVRASGLLAGLGALSVILGYRARIGAWAIVLFLLAVTPKMHNFWAVTDPMLQQMQMAMFMKNVSMLGGALLVAYWGAGPLSLDARKTR